eukprot:COSAG01_NODE_2839_length_6992_cov_15.825040_5_plen_241_part_00
MGRSSGSAGGQPAAGSAAAAPTTHGYTLISMSARGGHAALGAEAVMCVMLSASALMKAKGALTGSGHPAMGEGRPYPGASHTITFSRCCCRGGTHQQAVSTGWFLPVAAAHELVVVAAWCLGHAGAALLGASIFAGGVLHASLTVTMPRKGSIALIPLCVLGTATWYLHSMLPPSQLADKKSDGDSNAADDGAVKALSSLLQHPPSWLMGAAAMLGFGVGVALKAFNAGAAVDQGAAKLR